MPIDDPPEIPTGRASEAVNAGLCSNGAGVWFQTRSFGETRSFLFGDSTIEAVCRRLLKLSRLARGRLESLADWIRALAQERG